MKVELRAAQVRMIEELMGPRYELARNHCTLPAVAWRNILDRMKQDAYGPLGGHTDQPRAYYTTMSTIQAAVKERELHPALRSVGVMGVSAEVIPAWAAEGFRYSPYPIDNTRFVVLVPDVKEESGHTVTEWIETDEIDGSYLWSPSTHWDFVV